MADVIEINAQTGAVIERDFTPEELAQRDADAVEYAVRKAAQDLLDGNKTTLSDRAVAALQTNRDYLALASPSQAQAVAQVKILTRECSAVIRLLLGLVDEVD